MRFLFLTLCIVLVLTNYSPQEYDCRYSPQNIDAAVTYDLSKLHKNKDSALKFWEVLEVKTEREEAKDRKSTYKYAFNVCGDVQGMPHEACKIHKDGNFARENATSPNRGTKLTDQMDGEFGFHPAYQYETFESNADDAQEERCWRISRRDQQNQKFELLEEEHPTRGLKIIYDNGDWDQGCNYNGQFRARKFVLELECGNDPITEFAKQSLIEEGPQNCEYRLKKTVIAACPTQCVKPDDSKYCGGHGHCSVDPKIKTARCYCNIGFKGEYCAEEDPTEVPTSKGSCTEINSNGGTRYLEGGCTDGTLAAGLYEDGNCQKTSTKKTLHLQASGQCVSIFEDFRAQISCFGNFALLDHKACPPIPQPSESGTVAAGGMSAWVVVMCLLMVVLLGVVLYMCYNQAQSGVPLKNYLVLDENRGNEMSPAEQNLGNV